MEMQNNRNLNPEGRQNETEDNVINRKTPQSEETPRFPEGELDDEPEEETNTKEQNQSSSEKDITV